MSLNSFMDLAWNKAKNDREWLEERVVKKYREVSKLYEELYHTPFTEYDCINFPSYDAFIARDRKELKEKCIRTIEENLNDLNSLLGTNVKLTHQDLERVIKIGYISDTQQLLEDIVFFSPLPLTLILTYNLYTDPLSLGLALDLVAVGEYLIYLMDRKYNGPKVPHYDPSRKTIHLYYGRKDFFNPKDVSRVDVIHEGAHYILDKINSPAAFSSLANEGIAIYAEEVILGKYSPATDLTIKNQEARILDSALISIDKERRNELIRREFGVSINKKKEKRLVRKTIIRVNERPHVKGFTSVYYLVDKYGKDIVKDIVAGKVQA